MIKRKILFILTIMFSAFSFCQNFNEAKLQFEKAQTEYTNTNFNKALESLKNAKRNLNEATNPDIIFLEAKIRYASDANLIKYEKLLNEFIDKSKLNDPRRKSVLESIINLSKPNFLYENGNRVFKEQECQSNSEVNDEKCLLTWDLLDENGTVIGSIVKGTKKILNDVKLETFLINYINPQNPDEILQSQYYENINLLTENFNDIVICNGFSFKSFKISNPNEYLKDFPSIQNVVFDDTYIPNTLKNYLIEYFKIRNDRIGLIKEFDFPSIENEKYYFSKDFQTLFKKNKKKNFKLNISTNEWKRIKK